tara:strand:- start:1593 stop:2060 length:468 start_codon:yes stop_codon:yes gene_type:complete
MALKLGRISSIYVSFDLAVAPTLQLGKLVDITMNLNAQEVETTNHDSAGYREYLAGYIDGTIEGSARYDEADAEQMGLLDTFDTTPATTFSAFPQCRLRICFDNAAGAMTTGADYYDYTAIVTSMSLDSANEDVDNISFTFRLTGAPTAFRTAAP